ncbi:MAG: hypothetical protein K2Q26_16305 [Bdellovibrionales bacterium]|nr:hypothetical protein [Bdellovibrionales bacterium]
MKGLLFMAFIGTVGCAVNSPPTEKSIPKTGIAKIMEKPLITGASVSAGHLATSPGKILALRHTSASQIKTVAQGGRTSLDTVARLSDKDFEDRTVVIAVDAFFWDSFSPQSEKSLDVLKGFIERTAKLEIPLVLGEVPLLAPQRQRSAGAINAAIHNACERIKKCFVLPFDEIVKQILRDGFLDVDGKRYKLNQLLPDGLHVNGIASNHLADRIERLLTTP